MRLFSPYFMAGCLYPDALFRIKTKEKLLILTFDDGPDPDSTPLLLEILDKQNVKALFFCDGRAAEKFPDLLSRIKTEGHIIGNHGYNHLNGWATPVESYIDDVARAADLTSSDIFRPPFGHLTLPQYRKLRKQYKIVFWDVMPYDFDTTFGTQNSLRLLQKKIRPGSVIVLHDKVNANLPELVKPFIEFARQNGYRFVNSIRDST